MTGIYLVRPAAPSPIFEAARLGLLMDKSVNKVGIEPTTNTINLESKDSQPTVIATALFVPSGLNLFIIRGKT